MAIGLFSETHLQDGQTLRRIFARDGLDGSNDAVSGKGVPFWG